MNGMMTARDYHQLSGEDVSRIIDMYEYGYSIKYIAKRIDCSVGIVDDFISNLKEEAKVSMDARMILENRNSYINLRRDNKKKKDDNIPTINEVVVKALANNMTYGEYMSSGLYERDFGVK